MRLVTASLIAVLVATPLLAQEPVQEREHTVREGDTLWDLADLYFSNPFRWPAIYEANTTVVEDPHWIYPREVLVIPGLAADAAPPMVVQTRPVERPTRTVFYREPPAPPQTSEDATVLSEPQLTSFPVRPGEYNSAPYVANPSDLRVMGTFMRSIRDARRAGPPVWAHPQDRVFLDYVAGARPALGDRLMLVTVGRSVDGTPSGHRLIRPTGVVRITELAEDVMEAQIEAQYGPVLPDQLVVPMEVFPDFQVSEAEPVAGGSDLRGRILEFVDEQPMYGRAALALVDVGRTEGVREGDIFEAYLPERTERQDGLGPFPGRSETLPPEPVAHLRVVRVTGDFATVKVDHLELPRLEEGLPIHRIRMIP